MIVGQYWTHATAAEFMPQIGRFLSFARNRQNTTGHSGLDTCTVYRVALFCISDQHLSQLQTPTLSQPANRTPPHSPAAPAEHTNRTVL